MNVWNYIREHMLRHPGQRVCEDEAEMTYEELVVFAEILAKKIAGEPCCAVCCRREMAAAMALLACFAAGVTAVPLPVRYGERSCQRILETIRPGCMITDLEGELRVCRITDAGYRPPADPPALIMCTSGTTGSPKGVMLSERSIIANVRDISEYFSIGPDDTILIARPLYHCAVLTGEFLIALIRGVKIRFYSDAFQPAALIRLLKLHSITVFCSTPTLVGILARLWRQDEKKPLRHLVLSGECMSDAMGRRIRSAFPGANIYHVYGLTEAGPRVSYLPPEWFDRMPRCVGIPLSSVQVKIADANGCEVRCGHDGLLWVRGDHVMMGYYQAPGLTQQVRRDGWLCTGDVASQDGQGRLFIKGRGDDMIIRAGMNIYPQEIEAALLQDPRTREVLAYGVSDPDFGTQIALRIAGEFNSIKQIKQMCVQRLPAYQIPARIELVDALAKNGTGKILRGNRHAGI